MTPNETLLQKLSDWTPAGAGPHTLSAAVVPERWTATVTAERCDSMGCLVRELVLTRQTSAASTLRAWAAAAAARVTGLLEPLKVVEVDDHRDEALLRSQQPSPRGDLLLYYEVLLRGGGAATVRRYQASHVPGSHRERVAFALTHEVLAKLADDLTNGQ